MQLWHSMSIAQQLMPIYNITVHENNINVALNVTSDYTVGAMRHQHVTRANTSKQLKSTTYELKTTDNYKNSIKVCK